jgi:hypothetical protein
MKIIAAYALLAGTMMGLSPQIAIARDFQPPVVSVDFKMGNGRPDPTLFT